MCRTGSLHLSRNRKIRISSPRKAVASVVLLAVSACSGSDFEKLGSDFGDQVAKELLGVNPSELEKPGEQAARALKFAQNADALVATGAYEKGSVVATATCTGDRCQWTDDTLPARTVSDLFPRDIKGVAKGVTSNGETAFTYTLVDRITYGYWMEHSVFGLAGGSELQNDATAARFGFAGGDLTKSLPSASATWTGRMVGTAVGGAGAGTRLAGDATLSFSVDANTVGLKISRIRDNSNGNAWSVDAVSFEDVPVGADGTFSFGTSGNLIRGGFHGPAHAEAAGAFEKQDIVGSFGGKK